PAQDLFDIDLLDVVFSTEDFFFQAEDGIRERNVTGVQTCALPICSSWWGRCPGVRHGEPRRGCRGPAGRLRSKPTCRACRGSERSEERRVGKGGGGRLARVGFKEDIGWVADVKLGGLAGHAI